MPMDRKKYPADWEKLARAIKEEAGWKCEQCGKQCRRPGEKLDTHRRTLTVAHLNHKPWDCRRENLKALCAPCHLRYDAKHHAETRRKHMKEKEIRNNYTTHDLDEEQKHNVGGIKHQARNLALVINDACPDGREKSLALTKLEEATMWATAAIAREGA